MQNQLCLSHRYVILTSCLLLMSCSSGPEQNAPRQVGPATGNQACLVRPVGACTMDLNPCGNSSVCSCPEGYDYNASAGLCIVNNRGLADRLSGPEASLSGSCISGPAGYCTRDINACGNPGFCQCQPGQTYNAQAGVCLTVLK